MKHFILAICLAFFAFLAPHTAEAQFGNEMLPVEWEFSMDSVESDSGTVNLYFTAKIDKGWYVYSQTIEGDGPIPTSIIFPEGNKSFELVGSTMEVGEASEAYDPLFEIVIKKFKKEVVFTQTIRPLKKKVHIEGKVEYMTCDDTKCLPPADVPFSFSLQRTK